AAAVPPRFGKLIRVPLNSQSVGGNQPTGVHEKFERLAKAELSRDIPRRASAHNVLTNDDQDCKRVRLTEQLLDSEGHFRKCARRKRLPTLKCKTRFVPVATRVTK